MKKLLLGLLLLCTLSATAQEECTIATIRTYDVENPSFRLSISSAAMGSVMIDLGDGELIKHETRPSYDSQIYDIRTVCYSKGEVKIYGSNTLATSISVDENYFSTPSCLRSVDVSENKSLTTLDIASLDNTLNRKVNVVGCASLRGLHCANGEFDIDFEHCPNLTFLGITSIGECSNFEPCQKLEILSLSDFRSLLLDLSSFKLLEKVTLDNIGALELEFGDTPFPKNLSIIGSKLRNFDVPTGLEFLSLRDNELESIDLSQSKALVRLDVCKNKLTELDVSACTRLANLGCQKNFIEKLDLSNNKELESLSCFENRLSELLISECVELRQVECQVNRLTSLQLPASATLIRLDCRDNRLQGLDTSASLGLHRLYCADNEIISLDFRENKKLRLVASYGNPIEWVQVDGEHIMKVNDYGMSESLAAQDWGVQRHSPIITIDVPENAVGKDFRMNVTLSSIKDELIVDFGDGRRSYKSKDSTTLTIANVVKSRIIRIYGDDTAVKAIETDSDSDYIWVIDTSRCKNISWL